MVDVVNNSVNNSVASQRPKVGVINPPPIMPKVHLYSEKEAQMKFDNLNRELLHADRKVEYHDKKKNFLGTLVSIGIVASGLLLFNNKIRAQVQKIKLSSLKNIFKKKS